MNKKFSVFLIFLLVSTIVYGQNAEIFPQPTDLVTCPTAGILPRGAFLVDANIFRDGGLLLGMSVGVSGNLMFGISYGGSQIIGNKKVIWNEQPGVEVKYRMINEGMSYPALAIGFNSEGYGAYIKDLKRYEQKAKGFYLTASKNFNLLGNLGFHGGVNYNPLEKEDGDSDPSVFFGIDKDINRDISIFAEYDAAINDNDDEDISLGKGYLNAGFRFGLMEHFYFEFFFTDILINNSRIDYVNRELKINFIEFF